jgi:hypothetical protein
MLWVTPVIIITFSFISLNTQCSEHYFQQAPYIWTLNTFHVRLWSHVLAWCAIIEKKHWQLQSYWP